VAQNKTTSSASPSSFVSPSSSSALTSSSITDNASTGIHNDGTRDRTNTNTNVDRDARLWEALEALSQNQMEISFEKHCVLKVLNKVAPRPRWDLVVSGMSRSQRSASGTFSYFDGWDIYATREEALDCMFVNPLVRTADAEYEERDADDVVAMEDYLVDTRPDTRPDKQVRQGSEMSQGRNDLRNDVRNDVRSHLRNSDVPSQERRYGREQFEYNERSRITQNNAE
jgi:hypothetical protein